MVPDEIDDIVDQVIKNIDTKGKDINKIKESIKKGLEIAFGTDKTLTKN